MSRRVGVLVHPLAAACPPSHAHRCTLAHAWPRCLPLLPRSVLPSALTPFGHWIDWRRVQAEEEEADNGHTRPKVRRSQMIASASVRSRHASEQAMLDNPEPMSEVELAEARATLVAQMQPRETVLAAMRRLSGKSSVRAPTSSHFPTLHSVGMQRRACRSAFRGGGAGASDGER